MIKKITYIAYDGKEFDDEDECYDYETKSIANEFKDDIFFFDADGNRLPITEEGYHDSVYLKCKTKEAAEFLVDNFPCYQSPWDGGTPCAGCWYYNGGAWQDIGEILRYLDLVKQIYCL